MQWKNTTTKYGVISKSFHWLVFLLVTVLIVVGFFLDDVPDEYKGTVYNIHKLTGVLVFWLMVLRIIWSWCNVKPALPVNMPRWQQVSARVTHYLLYLLVTAMPLVGWIGSSASRKAPHIGDLTLTLPVPEDKALSHALFDVHEMIAYMIIALVCVHVAAALYHHYIKKDDILRRMLPG